MFLCPGTNNTTIGASALNLRCNKERLTSMGQEGGTEFNADTNQESVMFTRRNALMGAAIAALLVAAPALAAEDLKLPRQAVELVAPPFVHPHEQGTKQGPKIVEFKLTIKEKEVVIDEAGTKFQAMTFNGSMPGPLMVVHEGDYVEVTLGNPRPKPQAPKHRLQARPRGRGGRRPNHVNPGEQVVLRWKATRTGTFVYHCAPEGMIPWHVVSGMHGTVMVLPRDGLKNREGKPLRYDRVYYIGENDLYVPKDANGKYKSYDTPGEAFADTTEVMRKLIPTHVVFNGRVGALTGKNAMTAKVGETVMIVHSQANRDTRPHLIGGHGDYVWEAGKFNNPPQKDLETWFIRGGSAGAALYTFREPGIYAYVNHNLIEAVELGASAHIKVEGKWNEDLMKQVTPPGPIPPDKVGAADPVAVTR